MTGFTNETLGETWELKGDSSDEHALQARAEDYPLGRVPAGAAAHRRGRRAARPVGDRHLGLGPRAGKLGHCPPGHPGQPRQRGRLGARHPIPAAALCAGLARRQPGPVCHQHRLVRPDPGRLQLARSTQGQLAGLRAIKGDNNDNRNIVGPSSLQEVNYRGRKISHGIKLWLVGVDSAKDLLLGQLAIAKPGPGYVHTSQKLPREWYEQLTAEQRVLVKVNGKDVYRWVKRRPRNEVLDCFDAETEVLTHGGWRCWADVSYEDLLATVDLSTDLIEYQKPSLLIDKPYSGDMVQLKGKSIDVLVTPGHRMVTLKKQNRTIALACGNGTLMCRRKSRWPKT